MIIEAARLAASRLFSPEFRAVLFKSIGMTILLLVAAWFGLKGLFEWLALPWIDALLPGLPAWAGWFGIVAAVFAGIGLALGLALLVAPVTAIVAGIFLDDVAEVVAKEDYSADRPGKALPVVRSAQVIESRWPSSPVSAVTSTPVTTSMFGCALIRSTR